MLLNQDSIITIDNAYCLFTSVTESADIVLKLAEFNVLCISVYSGGPLLQSLMYCVYLYIQVDPYSVAAKDGRIREGDQIVQVSKHFSTFN